MFTLDDLLLQKKFDDNGQYSTPEGLKEVFVYEVTDLKGIRYRIFYRSERGDFVYKKIFCGNDGYLIN